MSDPGSLVKNDNSEQEELKTQLWPKLAPEQREKDRRTRMESVTPDTAGCQKHITMSQFCIFQAHPLPTDLLLCLTPWTEAYLVPTPVLLRISCCPWGGYFTPLKLWFPLL